jgi:hypothetical protein
MPQLELPKKTLAAELQPKDKAYNGQKVILAAKSKELISSGKNGNSNELVKSASIEHNDAKTRKSSKSQINSFTSYLINFFAKNQREFQDASSILLKNNETSRANVILSPDRLVAEATNLQAVNRELEVHNLSFKSKMMTKGIKNLQKPSLHIFKPQYSTQEKLVESKPQQLANSTDKLSVMSDKQLSLQRVVGYKTLRYNSLLRSHVGEAAQVLEQIAASELDVQPPFRTENSQDFSSKKLETASKSAENGEQSNYPITAKQEELANVSNYSQKDQAGAAGLLTHQQPIMTLGGSDSKNGLSIGDCSMLEQLKLIEQPSMVQEHSPSPSQKHKHNKRKSMVTRSTEKRNFLSIVPTTQYPKSMSMREICTPKNLASSNDLGARGGGGDEEDDAQEESRMNLTLNTTYIKKTSVLGAKKSSQEIGYSIKQNCTKVDQYVIISKIGTGSCGEVHLAVDSVTKNKVVSSASANLLRQ